MSSNKQHINEEHRLPEEWEEVVGKTQPKFNKSREAVWSEMMDQIDEQPQEVKVIQMNWFRYAAAAVLVLALASVSFMRFYTETITAPAGHHASALLPDGSRVELNAASEISYHPYWWRFSRDVNFEGEAFFDVTKGSTFIVRSQNGITEVLGTSFNINSRGKGYQVFCKTGKVSVTNTNSSVVLKPNEIAEITEFGELEKETANQDDLLAWLDYRFVFNAIPVRKVFEELEIQFDVSINLESEMEEELFTGSFSQSEKVEGNLSVICNSMGLTFKQSTGNSYSVRKN